MIFRGSEKSDSIFSKSMNNLILLYFRRTILRKMKPNKNYILLLTSLMSILAFAPSDLLAVEKETKESVLLAPTADVESVPRRCRVVKRYRPNTDRIYRIAVDVPNNSNFTNAFAEVTFHEKEGQDPLSTETVVLNTIKSKGKNNKDIEMESDEFKFAGNSENKTYTFTLKLYDNNKNLVETQRYSVSFGENSKKPQTNFAILLGATKVNSLKIDVEKEGDKLPESGTFDLSVGIENDVEKEVEFIQMVFSNVRGLDLNPTKVVLKFSGEKDGVRFFTSEGQLSFKGNLSEGTFDLEVSGLNADAKEIESIRSSYTSVQYPYQL